ncbi:DUF6461 domain-containing protein [Actinomadura sp. 21ATH]|uniref:DUF6461 domain-containing protein n=1 Tax=Actinomadura sp. 21ATH TaxID=1735444 RepID=UPI0035BF1248
MAMTPDALAAVAEWSWLEGRRRALGGFWTFVRGRSVEQAMAAFGADPATARAMTLDGSADEFAGREDGRRRVLPWARFGGYGAWTFVLEDMTDLGMRAVAALSAGTQAAYVSWTPKVTYEVAFYEHGRCVTAFEPMMEWSLRGDEPERFAQQMRALGIMPRPDDWRTGAYPNGLVHMLAFLTLVAGVRIPEEVAHGPLLTCALPHDTA